LRRIGGLGVGDVEIGKRGADRRGEGGLCAAPGTMVPVRITAADTYDLVGVVVGAQAMVGDALAARRQGA
jgi:hypothetical protein